MKHIVILLTILLALTANTSYAGFFVHKQSVRTAVVVNHPVTYSLLPEKPKAASSGWQATVSALCAFIGIFVGALPFGILAVGFSILSLKKNTKLRGLAIGGLVVGIIEIIIGIALIV